MCSIQLLHTRLLNRLHSCVLLSATFTDDTNPGGEGKIQTGGSGGRDEVIEIGGGR